MRSGERLERQIWANRLKIYPDYNEAGWGSVQMRTLYLLDLNSSTASTIGHNEKGYNRDTLINQFPSDIAGTFSLGSVMNYTVSYPRSE